MQGSSVRSRRRSSHGLGRPPSSCRDVTGVRCRLPASLYVARREQHGLSPLAYLSLLAYRSRRSNHGLGRPPSSCRDVTGVRCRLAASLYVARRERHGLSRTSRFSRTSRLAPTSFFSRTSRTDLSLLAYAEAWQALWPLGCTLGQCRATGHACCSSTHTVAPESRPNAHRRGSHDGVLGRCR